MVDTSKADVAIADTAGADAAAVNTSGADDEREDEPEEADAAKDAIPNIDSGSDPDMSEGEDIDYGWQEERDASGRIRLKRGGPTKKEWIASAEADPAFEKTRQETRMN